MSGRWHMRRAVCERVDSREMRPVVVETRRPSGTISSLYLLSALLVLSLIHI